ncbi:hypothetical protein QC764_0019440 [Podospora pseudoanserina]|uniref:Zn(2)-C6 fungal-type domain-containing protein n=1 Tax=Podospora pseudoanserina TaxID=2609844 RepID=A0ABR0IQL5_9PEZI|nr:hypothetical protein QC764_0019440 [Podospora pseudoanserina]
MSPNRNARTSRKGEIPRNFIRNWHSSGSRGATPLVRRPITACQGCRAAKVKCDGRQECNRCTNRGIVCRYVNTEPAEPFQRSGRQPSTDAVAPQTDPKTVSPKTTSLNFEAMDATDHSPLDTMTYPPMLDIMTGWTSDTIPPSFDDFDWQAIDPSLNTTSSELDTIFHSPLVSPPLDLDLSYATPSFEVGSNSASTTTTAVSSSMSTTTATNITKATSVTSTASASSFSPSQLFTSPNCACREGLAALVPRLKSAIREKQLDEVIKVTGDVMRGCQEIVDCAACQLTCTDLICMMSVFQQTDSCFDHISRAELDGSIKLNFGGQEILINDPNLRAMLVMDLVQHATMVLDAISTKGQTMLRALGTPSLLARANIGYLETVIGDFRKLLRTVADQANSPGFSPRSPSRTLESVSR